MNERVTENIVRNLLREKGYYNNDNIIIEEQKSDNPKIDKLLKNASKSGGGRVFQNLLYHLKINPMI